MSINTLARYLLYIGRPSRKRLFKERKISMMTQPQSEDLYQNRNKCVAKSFYRQLKTEGFTHEQIIELSTTLLDLVTEDLREHVSPAIAK